MRAAECSDPAMRDDWLELAAEWRRLAEDGDAQATTARLIQGPAAE